MKPYLEVAENFSLIQDEIQKLYSAPNSITLIGASKSQSIDKLISAYNAGLRNFGENYVQEAILKTNELNKAIKRNTYNLHFIGKIQSKKSKQIANIFDRIHSLDSIKSAGLINEELKKLNKIMPSLIEVNISELPQRGGVLPTHISDFLKDIEQFEQLKIDGLMCIASNSSQEVCQMQFRKMKGLLNSLNSSCSLNTKLIHLSMGMSNDYKIAIQEGATMVRIGSKLFGERGKVEG
ncbi:MAG: YggS family pyridoxal phosphate-dependent enzyme [Oligoflexia bacterium]|nr:YggS family pyridoxal phosphate-dependent enzyme [Oligoflexia bacterium]